ncbi:MAG TPA: sigma-70 family RNA polymerase sigma factor [Planctomycetaceae bacterium]|nr:sigma-70 family RNA polymerase sigma factor [Planctomycetaceae bacterium]HQZ64737.1 sigma-70 family RNA polymerase sigma factor [Planctomycetaceae bacterium]
MSEHAEEQFANLIRRARDGDDSVLGELLHGFRPYLKLLADRVANGRLAGRIDSSDVVQQTYLSAVRRFDEFSGSDTATLGAWLRAIQERNLIDFVRQHAVAEKRSVGREVPSANVAELADFELTSPSRRLMRGENAVKLASAISDLPEDQAEAIRLRHLDQLSLEQIAEQMKRSKHSVANLLHRGIMNLRDRLAIGDEES